MRQFDKDGFRAEKQQWHIHCTTVDTEIQIPAQGCAARKCWVQNMNQEWTDSRVHVFN